jgi:hypothetical protein
MESIGAHLVMEQHAGGGDGVRRQRRRVLLWAKRSRSRVKRSSGVEGTLRRQQRAPGEAVEVEGALRRRRRAPGIGGVEDLKHVSGKNLLSVDRAA